jgi:ABC-type spermidine/putrescine transport system permease subunit II
MSGFRKDGRILPLWSATLRAAVLAVIVSPLLLLLIISILDVDHLLYAGGVRWTGSNYLDLLHDGAFWRALWSSVVISTLSASLAAISGAAFVLLSLRGRFGSDLATLMLTARLLPASVIAPSAAYVLSNAGLLDTHIGAAFIIFTGLIVVFVISVIAPVRSISRASVHELRLLGAGNLDLARVLILPVAGSAAMAGVLICWGLAFQEYYLSNFLISSPDRQTFAVLIARGMTQHQIGYGRFAAAAYVTIVITLAITMIAVRLLQPELSGPRSEAR